MAKPDQPLTTDANEEPKEENEVSLRDVLFWVVAGLIFIVWLIISRVGLHLSWKLALLQAASLGFMVPFGTMVFWGLCAMLWLGITWLYGRITHKDFD